MNCPGERQIARSTPGYETWARERLTAELANPHDVAARWCAVLMLAALPDAGGDTIRPALLSAVARETCRENLRSYAAVLAGADPLMI